MDGVLHCNHKSCHTPLTSEAWLTSCSHIFCSEHVPPAPASTRKCPCCSRDLRERNDVYKRNLNPSDPFKSVVLAGFSPSNIIEIGFKALEFLNFQSFHEKMFLQSYIKRQHLKLAKAEVQKTGAETCYQAKIDELKNLVQQQTQECEKLQRDLDNHIRKSKFLEEKVQNKNRQLHKMLAKYEMQRQTSHRSDRAEQLKNMNRRGFLGHEQPMFCSQQSAPPNTGADRMFCSQQSPPPSTGAGRMFCFQQSPPPSTGADRMFCSQQLPRVDVPFRPVANRRSNNSSYDGRDSLYQNL